MRNDICTFIKQCIRDAQLRNTQRSENKYKRRNVKWTTIILDYGGLTEMKSENRDAKAHEK